MCVYLGFLSASCPASCLMHCAFLFELTQSKRSVAERQYPHVFSFMTISLYYDLSAPPKDVHIYYIYIDICLSTPCTSWCCSCASRDGHTLPQRRCAGPIVSLALARIFLAQSEGWPAFVVKMEGCQCQSVEDTYAEQLATAQLYHRTAEWGRTRASYGKGWLSGCGPSPEETPQSWRV